MWFPFSGAFERLLFCQCYWMMGDLSSGVLQDEICLQGRGKEKNIPLPRLLQLSDFTVFTSSVNV